MVRSPLTGEQAEVLERIPVAELVAKWEQDFGMKIADEFEGEPEVLRCLCPDSQLEFFAPAALAGGGEFYAQLQRFDWYYMPWKWEYGAALEVLEPLQVAGEGLLEIGCGRGEFLEHAGKAGIPCRGIELNEAAVEKAVEAGLKVEARDVMELAGEMAGRFDAVSAFQVLEHIAEPLDFLKACVELVRPGGRLLFSTPDGHGFCGRIPSLKMLLDAPPHHMGKWNGASYQFLTRILPLRMRRIRYEPLQEYHLDWYLESQLRHPGIEDRKSGKIRKKVRSALADYARSSRCFEDWKGHTIFVEFERV